MGVTDVNIAIGETFKTVTIFAWYSMLIRFIFLWTNVKTNVDNIHRFNQTRRLAQFSLNCFTDTQLKDGKVLYSMLLTNVGCLFYALFTAWFWSLGDASLMNRCLAAFSFLWMTEAAIRFQVLSYSRQTLTSPSDTWWGYYGLCLT